MTEEWPWLEERPVFSTRGESGSKVARVPPDATRRPIGAEYLGILCGFMICVGLAIPGTGLAFGTALADEEAAGWWWLALAIPAAIGGVFSFSGLFVEGTERIMKSSALGMVYLVGVLGGLSIAFAALSLWHARTHPWTGRFRTETDFFVIATTVCALACVVSAVLAVRSVRRAQRDVDRVLRLGRSTRRYEGFVARLPDPAEWNDGGDVPIRYRDEHEAHTIRVRLNTYAHTIPVVGSRVIVFVGADGDMLVELDPQHPPEFYPHSSRYESDTSGGGS